MSASVGGDVQSGYSPLRDLQIPNRIPRSRGDWRCHKVFVARIKQNNRRPNLGAGSLVEINANQDNITES